MRHIAVRLELDWPYRHHAVVYSGVRRFAHERHWLVAIDEFIEHTLPGDRSNLAPVDGVIARANAKLVRRCQELNIPLVNVWANSPVREQVSGVATDSAAAGRLRAEHLMSRGLERFVILIASGLHEERIELAAFRDALQMSSFDCLICEVPFQQHTVAQWRTFESAIKASMDRWKLPIGLAVRWEKMAHYVAQQCQKRGWRIPEDVSIIAGQNEPLYCEQSQLRLTSVDYDHEKIGYTAAALLNDLMDAKDANRWSSLSAPRHIVTPIKGLVPRKSTDSYAFGDPTMDAAIAFINREYHREISPEAVAKAANIGLRSLQRKFRTQLGRGVADEIALVRMRYAQHELAFTNTSIQKIAQNAGFREARLMLLQFRRVLNTTPSDYRKKRQGN